MRLSAKTTLSVAIVAAILLGAVALWAQPSPSGNAIEVVIPTAAPVREVVLKTYVSGAVRNPGIYLFKEGDRLADAIEFAGGAREDAELAGINLALRLKDEDHWHIAQIGEVSPDQAVRSADRSGKIDVNSADAGSLTSLPGIGSLRAQSIVRYRDRFGPFRSVEDLLDVSGIGPSTLNSIQGLVEAR